jgi:hypothetical protein
MGDSHLGVAAERALVRLTRPRSCIRRRSSSLASNRALASSSLVRRSRTSSRSNAMIRLDLSHGTLSH